MSVQLSLRRVIDSSAVVALLSDRGEPGRWVRSKIEGFRLAAPDLMPYEVSNILRRHTLAGKLDSSAATLAHQDLLASSFDLFPHVSLATRAWDLRANLTIYDGVYMALAEGIGCSLITLDRRLARATDTCSVLTYEESSLTASGYSGP
jgi:predicted nucleic acid-binding protein